MSVIYGILYVPRTAWRSPSLDILTNLGVLVRLGLAGVGECVQYKSLGRMILHF